MEEINFASDRVRELLTRLEGIQFFCAVAASAGAGLTASNPSKGQSTIQNPNVGSNNIENQQGNLTK